MFWIVPPSKRLKLVHEGEYSLTGFSQAMVSKPARIIRHVFTLLFIAVAFILTGGSDSQEKW